MSVEVITSKGSVAVVQTENGTTVNVETDSPITQVLVNDAVPMPFPSPGEKGDPGDDGTDGDDGLSAYAVAVLNGFVGTESQWLESLKAAGNYTHIQGVPAAVWTIHHNLGFKPNILVENSAHETVIGEIQNTDNNTAVITFSAGFAGEAYCS